MNFINILHLSDLHFSKKKEKDILKIKIALLNDLERLNKTENFSPDIILFSGDLVQAGDDDEFKEAFGFLFKPLLEKVKLDQNFLVISPGNHDIQRDQIDEIIEKGLVAGLTDKPTLNEFLDKNLSKDFYFSRLTNFNKFKIAINSKFCSDNSVLHSTYKFNIRGITIGISNLNSAWRATGKPNDQDYGKLLIGERQVDSSWKFIEETDIKIAMAHHPMDSLLGFERLDLKRTLLSKFDFLFFGHNHEISPELIEAPINRTIISNGGCLFSKPEYFNGYSCISKNIDTDQVRVIAREYFEKRREFDKALSYIPDGEKTYNLSSEAKSDYSTLVNLNVLSLKQHFLNVINQKLLTSANRSLAPKEIDEIFVKPPLSSVPEMQAISSSKKTKFIDIDKLIKTSENLLIIGKKESGKSTLLDYIGKETFENSDPLKIQIPFQINYRNMPSGKNQILKEMYAFYAETNEDIKVKELLSEGKCVIIFDDFAFLGEKKLKALIEFIKNNKTNRFIFTIDENFYQALNMKEMPDLGINSQSVYLHSFRTNDARALTKKWFKYDIVDVDSVLEKALRTISKINLPRTPVILSIFLWILEKEEDFRPINKASLLERFLDLLLEKFSTSEIRYAKIDYRNKIHYLSHIAKYMVENNSYVMTKFDLEKETVSYFEKKGLKTSVGEFLKFFILKGIFVIYDDMVFFKFKCFCEFFVAKRMEEDDDFYQKILKKENYLAFSEELNYLSGLQRNNKKLIEELSTRITDSFEYHKIDLDLNLFDNISLDKSPLETQKKDEIKNALRECHLEERKKDAVFDGVYPCASKDGRSIRRISYNNYKACLMENLILYSKLIRNCELINDKEFKKNHLNHCIECWAQFILLMISVGRDTIEKARVAKGTGEIVLDLSEPENQNTLNWIVSIIIPLCIYIVMQQSVSSEKLENIIVENIDNGNFNILKLILNFLYIDMQLPDYLNRMKKLIKDYSKKKYYLELIYQKLGVFIMMKTIKKKEVDDIAELIADTYVKLRPDKKHIKAKLVSDLKSRRILLNEQEAI